jgi:mono/diheme cytochrome c family protein
MAPRRRTPSAARRLPARTGTGRWVLAIVAGAMSAAATAAPHFPGADLANGRHLHHERKCAACHSEKTGRDEGFIYLRDERKVKTLADLRRYVSLCNSELRLELFPDDERDVAAYLNEQFYRLGR